MYTPTLQFVRETYGTEEELQEQAVEWLEQQDLRDFQREYEAELAQAAVQFGEAEVRASGAGLCKREHGRELLAESYEVKEHLGSEHLWAAAAAAYGQFLQATHNFGEQPDGEWRSLSSSEKCEECDPGEFTWFS